jgi:galactonate dehydratase
MKIEKLEALHADGGWDTYSFLKITTDAGLIGWSEFNESRLRGMTGIITGLGAALVGQDPCAIGRIDAALYAKTRPTAGGLTAHAIAAIENACLDIKGKALGVPVCELLGGAVRDRLPVYW